MIYNVELTRHTASCSGDSASLEAAFQSRQSTQRVRFAWIRTVPGQYAIHWYPVASHKYPACLEQNLLVPIAVPNLKARRDKRAAQSLSS